MKRWKLGVLVLLTIVLTSFEAWGGKPPKPPPPPPDGGTIYVTAWVDGEGQHLYGMAADGSGLTALGQGNQYYSDTECGEILRDSKGLRSRGKAPHSPSSVPLPGEAPGAGGHPPVRPRRAHAR